MIVNFIPDPGLPIYFGGSRDLPETFFSYIFRFVFAVFRAGCAVTVGDATGADAFVISSALEISSKIRNLQIFSVARSDGAGFWAGSASRAVMLAAAMRVPVRWLAGGGFEIPLVARLLRRSLVASQGCQAAVFFLASRDSRGSLKVAADCVERMPVFAFLLAGGAIVPDPLPGRSGCWIPARFFDARCWLWEDDQADLFL